MDSDRQSLTSIGSRHTFERPGSDIRKTGYLRKLKTMKKKFFVLRSTSSSGPARLEYYDNEKKFKSCQPAKRSILLHTCFNINKKSDGRHGKYGIVLYMDTDCFTVLTDSEKEQDDWLEVMLEFQNEYLPDGDMHKEHYEHVWQVSLQPRGLGERRGTKGQYRLCLNGISVSLVKANASQPQFTIQLVTIRSVAHNECSFRLEVGKYAPTGEGEFWMTVDDPNIAKDMHETLLRYMNSVNLNKDQKYQIRPRRESHSSPGKRKSTKLDQRPASYYPSSTSGWPSDATSPSSPNYPVEHLPPYRPRSDTAESRSSRISSHSHHDDPMGFNNGDQIDLMNKEHCISYVPADMSPPPSPGLLDEQINAYLIMDMSKNKPGNSSPTSLPVTSSYTNTPGLPTTSPSYLQMKPSYHHCSKGDLSPSIPMHPYHPPPPQMSAPIPIHSFSEPHHSTPLPTVREAGSNEGYLPMDLPNSPASSTGMLRPDPAKCMLSDDATGLPPRTYSLGSKPVAKKYAGYMDMVPRKGLGSDNISRATSAPHIIHNLKGRRDHADSPTPSASPLSMSVKSDDSDSFMEYMSMRPRTSSDSFNYRPRTSSFGKLQQNCRPRSQSHGQGTRPFNKFNKLSVEQSRISQDPIQRTSRESSLHGSFDSLRVSNESLRRMSQDMRQPSGSNASDYAEMRGTPSPQTKSMKSEPDGYINMQVGVAGRKSSPHRMRTDSSSSHPTDLKSSSSERLHQQTHLQQIDDYTEMAPINSGHNSQAGGDSYMNMDYGSRHSFSSDTKSHSSTSSLQSSRQADSMYMNMDMDSKNKKTDDGRSLSMENVDSTYVVYDPSHAGNKPRTGSLGSKDKKITRPGSARKSSSISMSSSSSGNALQQQQQQQSQTTVSTSTRAGGSSDSIRKAGRQSSMEKYGSIGKDFRKKSGSTGSRPNSAKNSYGLGKDPHMTGPSGLVPVRPKAPLEEPTDEYIEFAPTATRGESNSHQGSSSLPQPGLLHASASNPIMGRSSPFASSGSFSSGKSPNPTLSPADEAYTMYDPAPSSVLKSTNYQQPSQSHHLHHHHHPPPSNYGYPPSLSFTSSNQAKQVAAKEYPEYVGFDPAVKSSSSSAPAKHVEAKEVPEYVGFEPGIIPSSTSGTVSSGNLHSRPTPPQDISEYIGYEPVIHSQQSFTQPGRLASPSTAVAYIQGSSSQPTSNTSKQKQHSPKQPKATFESSSSKLQKPERATASTSPTFPRESHAFASSQPVFGAGVTPGKTVAAPSPTQPHHPHPHVTTVPVPPLPVQPSPSSNTRHQLPAVPQLPVTDTSEYMSYSPAVSSGKSPVFTETLDTPTSSTQNSEQKGAGNKGKESPAQPFSQLTVDVSCEPLAENIPLTKNTGGKNSGKKTSQGQHKQQQQQKKQQLQQQPVNMQRQFSAPAGHSGIANRPSPFSQDSPQQQPLSPLPTNDQLSSTRHKHLSGSSVIDSPSPTGGSSRQKHLSGSSNSSQKSRRVSSDSEKSLKKGTKSDSNSSLNSSSGGKTKRRIPSGEKSPAGSAEKSPISPSRGNGEFFCGDSSLSSGKSLEAKIIPVEAKIRHSLGDMTGVVGVVNKECQGQCGLSRPGSTPCMQNLDPNPDPGSRSAGDTPSPNSRSAGLQFPAGPRSRHSLSDLAEMTLTSSMSPLNSETNMNPSTTRSNSNSGSGESYTSDVPAKPLNYVKLDLSCNEGQGDADGKSPRVKSRNSSDADEKQPPLSYAQIDFVKSQNLNKALAVASSGDNSSSKS